MKNIKKATAIIMGATIMMSSAAMVMADNNINSVGLESSISVENNITSKVIIKSIEKSEEITRILVTPVDDSSMDIMLDISDDTKIDLETLKEGDIVLATYSKAMTRSIPPQSNAIEIVRENSNMDDIAAQPNLSLMNLNAIISEITDEEGYKSILVDDSNDKDSQISLNIDNNTIVMNANGEAVNFSDLKAGDRINVVHSLAMTFSLPPQTYAYAVIVNNEQAAVPQYIEAGKVATENDTTTIESKDGNYIIRVDKDTQIVPFKTKNIVTAQDIVEGTTLFAWYDIMTASMPAQATANKIMILPQIDNQDPEQVQVSVDAITVLDKVIINGEELDLKDNKIKDKDNFVMLPLRPIAEKLGFGINWNEETNSVELVKGTVNAMLADGEDKYTIQHGKSLIQEVKSVGMFPMNIDGYLYVPSDFFGILLEDSSVLSSVDGILNINLE